MPAKKYTPINCNLYDVFTEAAVLKTSVTLKITLNEGESIVTDFIVDLVTENKEEFVILAQNGKHRLDKVMIVQV